MEIILNAQKKEVVALMDMNVITNKVFAALTKNFFAHFQTILELLLKEYQDKPRFAWSSQINSCWRFSYYGAKGNYNNFPNFQECVEFCGNEK
ncbi:BPTI/Kunitz inhibitor domain-containing protein [Meloidogyne graminicola]|uniref:BPTI/Kunitz inhibitor domain-containing protein n=1 Tax=Meloidogyne graminicola TaxID=189291 RepID=A0A8S9ZIN7_9BILA|nr:BPTI/Kunitz inhibitor domain-containing protein [Meloidogyne graminicola]